METTFNLTFKAFQLSSGIRTQKNRNISSQSYTHELVRVRYLLALNEKGNRNMSSFIIEWLCCHCSKSGCVRISRVGLSRGGGRGKRGKHDGFVALSLPSNSSVFIYQTTDFYFTDQLWIWVELLQSSMSEVKLNDGKFGQKVKTKN